MTAVPPTIEVQNLSKWYGEVMGLNEVSAHFGPGVTGLLGPNGAGKSTMLKLITGMLAPSLGEARICGEKPFGRPAVMRRLGLVPEQDASYPRASALAVTAYLTRLQGFTRRDARRRAQRALERVGLAHAMHRSVGGYSKGMRQRAKLAQAIAHEPDVYVLDEPLNGLDPPGRRDMGGLIRSLAGEGCCVLVSSHVLHEVEGLAEELVVLHHGRVLAEGTSRTIREELSEFPLTIRIQAENAAGLASVLVAVEGVSRVQRDGTTLEILTNRSDLLFEAVTQEVAAGRHSVTEIAATDEDLESVFRYLTA